MQTSSEIAASDDPFAHIQILLDEATSPPEVLMYAIHLGMLRATQLTNSCTGSKIPQDLAIAMGTGCANGAFELATMLAENIRPELHERAVRAVISDFVKSLVGSLDIVLAANLSTPHKETIQ